MHISETDLIVCFNIYSFIQLFMNIAIFICLLISQKGLPGGSVGKESACNAGDLGLLLGWEDPLEKEMATHSSTLAWQIPWTEEPGGLQSMGSLRVRHD